MLIQIVTYDQKFLDLSWNWLNDHEIKKLTNTPTFSRDEQTNWYNNLEFKKDYLIWGVQFAETKIGVCGLKKITKHDCEYWGYIGEKTYWGKGIGRIMMEILEFRARDMQLQSIWLQVLNDNLRAINLYKKLGSTTEKQIGNLIFMRKAL